jgi:hypothetical protein
MNQPTKRVLLFVIAMLTLLTACAPAAAVPTEDPEIIQEQIEQAVALTVAAQNAQATEQQALIVPTNTPLPTQTEAAPATETPLIPTATPFVIVPATNTVSAGGGGGGTVVQQTYACEALNRRPFDNQVFKPNDEFDIRWTIVNTGTRTMRAGLDLEYLSGPEMTAVKFIELPELDPGESYQVVMDAVAPSQQGFHVMTWRVEGPLCFPYTAINVERP